MYPLHGTAQHYAWGTIDAIPALLRQQPDGTPHAEYWLGTHPLGPTRAGDIALDELISTNPALLGDGVRQAFGDELPFLMKVLSARRPLSIQVHPSRDQAEHGYARENAAGIPLDAVHRVYRDPRPKPEILIALTPFETLSGFRDPVETAALLTDLGVAEQLGALLARLSERRGATTLLQVFLEILTLDAETTRTVDVVLTAARRHVNHPGAVGALARTALELAEVFPGDRGILAALLMNRIALRPGEAVFVPAGQLHAHLRGTGVEVMANSDNVIRGGLTPKHVDVPELIKLVDFEPRTPGILTPRQDSPGIETYAFSCPEFDAWRVLGGKRAVRLPGDGSARILLVTEGTINLRNIDDRATILRQGDAAFLGADERGIQVRGDGVAFLSASGTR